MKNVYIGKPTGKGAEVAICKVLYSDIRSGNAIVFNRAVGKFDTVTFSEKVTLPQNVRKLAEDTEYQFK